MAKEIERKFLVRKEILIPLLQDPSIERKVIAQFYLVSTPGAAVRIRQTAGCAHAVLTVKAGGNGISTDEFEFDVPSTEYEAKLGDRVGHEIVKTRHLLNHNGRTWEVDVFGFELEGLVVAELECDDAADVTDLPEWVSSEVTYDGRYKNAVMALRGMPPEPDKTGLIGMAAKVANNRRVMDMLATLTFDPPNESMASTGWPATLNPISKEANREHKAQKDRPNIIITEDPPMYLVEGWKSVPMRRSTPAAEQQASWERRMRNVVRVDPDVPFSDFPIKASASDNPSEVSAAELIDSTTKEGALLGSPLEAVNFGHSVDFSPMMIAKSGLSEEARKALLDDIVIGEIADPESAELAEAAAKTGHLVWSEFHKETADLSKRLDTETIARTIKED